jgi:antitoxin HicB
MKKILHYNLIFRPESEGGFTVVVPSLPGCVTYGKTLKEAKDMASDAIVGYLYSLKKHGEPITSDADNFVATIDIENKLAYA